MIEHGEKLKPVFRNAGVHSGPIEQIHVLEKRDLVISVARGDPRVLFHNALTFQLVKEFKHEAGIAGSFFDALDEVLLLSVGGGSLALFDLQSEKFEPGFGSSRPAQHYCWVRSRRALACSVREEQRSYVWVRYFE